MTIESDGGTVPDAPTEREWPKAMFDVPIYDATVRVLVAEDIAAERKKLERLFGPVPDEEDYDALCSYSNGQYALFFTPRALVMKVVAHEVFHLTHRIMEWVGGNFDSRHHETTALLHGWLMDEVCKVLGIPTEPITKQ